MIVKETLKGFFLILCVCCDMKRTQNFQIVCMRRKYKPTNKQKSKETRE